MKKIKMKINTVGAYISPYHFPVTRDSCLCAPLGVNSYKPVCSVDNSLRA